MTMTNVTGVPTPPSSSATFTVDVNTPALVKVFDCAQTPPPAMDEELAPPPSHVNEHVRTSLLPGSETDAVTATAVPTLYTDPDVGLVNVIVGDRFVTVSVPDADAGAVMPSVAVSVSTNVPSSLHVTVVSSDVGLATTHAAPGSVPAP